MIPIDYSDLVENKKEVTGIVTGFSRRGGVNYIFYVGNQKYEGYTFYPRYSYSYQEFLIGKRFPVIYSSKKISNNEMLLTKDMFERYEVNYPDSLKRIE